MWVDLSVVWMAAKKVVMTVALMVALMVVTKDGL